MAAAALRSVLRCVLPSLLLSSPPQIRCCAKAAFVSEVQFKEVAGRLRSCSRQALGLGRDGLELPRGRLQARAALVRLENSPLLMQSNCSDVSLAVFGRVKTEDCRVFNPLYNVIFQIRDGSD